MSAFREFLVRAFAFVTRRRGGSNGLTEELGFHMQMIEEELRRRGMDDASARREARVRLGGARQIMERYDDQRTLPILETVPQDVRYACRTLLRTPGFTAAALVTLGLGIGANAAIFSVAQTVLLRPLPYADPGRLVAFGDRDAEGLPTNIGYQTYADFRDQSRAFEQVAAIRSWQSTLVTTEAERLNGMRVSWNFFGLLGARPALGRDFRPEDDRPDRWRVLVLSDGLWRRRFGADPGVIGRAVRMNDQTYEIVGVMPPSFEPLISAYFYKPAELWAPLGYDGTLPYACRGCQHLRAIGRVRAGTSPERATADLERVRGSLMAAMPQEYPPRGMAALPLQQLFAGQLRGGLYVLVAAVGFVLLIACANVANLLLARALNRTRELAVRAALGASRGRLMRQMLLESLVLSAAGGLLGLLLAGFALPVLVALAPVNIPRIERVEIDRVVLGFTAAVSVLTGVLFGLVPAVRATSAHLLSRLSTNSRGSAGAESQRARQLLVVADLALALVLLTGAGLMVKSLARLMHVDPGFTPERVLTLQFSLVGEQYREDAAVLRFIDRAVEQTRALPGVQAAAVGGQIPMGGNGDTFGFHIDGLMHANPAEDPSAERYSVTSDYFRVMQIPLERGRLFTPADTASSPPVMVISRSTEQQLFKGVDPIGRRVRVGNADSGPWRTIVGVVGDVHHVDLTIPATPQMYLPQSQMTDSFLVLTVKTATRDSAALAPAIRAVLRELDPSVPVYDVATLEALLGRSLGQRRFVMTLLGGFASLALLLAAVGLYGVVSYTVLQRSREVGVRVALGASRADIAALFLRSGLATVIAGLAAGLTCAAGLTHFLQTLLFGVHALDPSTLAGAVLALTSIACAAHWFPIRRALRVDPALVLRQD